MNTFLKLLSSLLILFFLASGSASAQSKAYQKLLKWKEKGKDEKFSEKLSKYIRKDRRNAELRYLAAFRALEKAKTERSFSKKDRLLYGCIKHLRSAERRDRSGKAKVLIENDFGLYTELRSHIASHTEALSKSGKTQRAEAYFVQTLAVYGDTLSGYREMLAARAAEAKRLRQLEEERRLVAERAAEAERLKSFEYKVVAEAKKYLGTRYVYGASSPKRGFDCSGFTMFVMNKCGVSLPHASYIQGKKGRRIRLSEVRPGDLLFFGGTQSRKGITHVAMVSEVSDEGFKIIHAVSRGVTIDSNKSSIWKNYWAPKFLFARRVGMLREVEKDSLTAAE